MFDRLAAFDADADLAALDALARRRDLRELTYASIDPATLQAEVRADEGLVYVVADLAFELRQALGPHPVALDGNHCLQIALAVSELTKQPAQDAFRQRHRRRRTADRSTARPTHVCVGWR